MSFFPSILFLDCRPPHHCRKNHEARMCQKQTIEVVINLQRCEIFDGKVKPKDLTSVPGGVRHQSIFVFITVISLSFLSCYFSRFICAITSHPILPTWLQEPQASSAFIEPFGSFE